MASAMKIYDGFSLAGVGTTISIIVKHHSHLRSINFNLPLLIAIMPTIPGVEHVGGNMFKQIPPTDVLILHDWDNEHCMRILNKCQEAIPANGKVIIMDAIF
eukprot:Gb_26421 [translate_table: standard]